MRPVHQVGPSPHPYPSPATPAPPRHSLHPTPDLTPHTPHHTSHLPPSPTAPHPTPHTPHPSGQQSTFWDRWGLSLKSPQPQNCLRKAPWARGTPSGWGARSLEPPSRAPPSCSCPSFPTPRLRSLCWPPVSHLRHLVLPAGSRGGPRGRDGGLESPEAVALAPCLGGCPAGQRAVGLRGCSSWAGGTAAGWGLWGPRRSRLSSGDIWEGWRRALPLGFQKLLEEWQ